MRQLTKSLAFATVTFLAMLGVYEGGKSITGDSVVYADKLTGGLPTVCGGITHYSYKDRPIIVGEVWTKEECEAAEKKVVTEIQIRLSECMPYSTQSALEAITSLSYNVGVDKVCSQSRAVRLINVGKMKEGCEAIAFGENGQKVWATAGGVYYRGLHNRRLDEMRHCLRDSR